MILIYDQQQPYFLCSNICLKANDTTKRCQLLFSKQVGQNMACRAKTESVLGPLV
jgi:hypothetical protein